MKKNKRAAVVISIMCILSLTGCSIFGNFDAEGYTQALLDQMFQGDTKELTSFDKDVTEKELSDQYKEYMDTFTTSLTTGLMVNDMMAGKYNKLCREIFRTQKYAVTGSEKISKKEYRVTVEIQPTDVFIKWNQALKNNMQELQKKIEAGEYKGDQTEILGQMQSDIVEESYELLKTAYKEAEYSKKENIVLTIKQNESEKFGVDDQEISHLITKILRLDEILD